MQPVDTARHEQSSSADGSDDSYSRALRVAFRFMGYRSRSVDEVRRRVGRQFSEPVTQRVLEALAGYGYLDDAAFAVAWRDARSRRGPRGVALLRRELRQKGLQPDVIDAALEEVDEVANAYRAGARRAERWLQSDGIAAGEFRAKMWGFLQRRGFSSGVCRDTVERLRMDFAGGPDD